MASLLGKLVQGGPHKEEDQLPPGYAGALAPTGHGGTTSTTPPSVIKEVEKPTEETSGYKTVVAGAGYKDLKEDLEGESTPIEKHSVDEYGVGVASAGSFGSNVEHATGTVVESKHLHDKEAEHHKLGPMQKIKHKVKGGLSKVRHKKKDRAGDESSSSTSSDDEGGAKTGAKTGKSQA